MRTISIDELPDDLHHHVVITSGERSRYRRMAVALERTLSRCKEIHADYESKAALLRENSEKQGFASGFRLFFCQLTMLFDDLQRRQKALQTHFLQQVNQSLSESLQDPLIVERIIHHMREKCGHQTELRIIIPRAVKLPEGADASNYMSTDDNHITVQNDRDVWRFPSDSLCRQWLADAEETTAAQQLAINSLIPDLLRDIAAELLALSEQSLPASSLSDQEKTI